MALKKLMPYMALLDVCISEEVKLKICITWNTSEKKIPKDFACVTSFDML